MTSSYPPIIVQPYKWKKPSSLQEFLPIDPAPDLIDSPPPLPTLPPRAQPFSKFFSVSTHIVPAVHLRQGPYIPIPDLSPILLKNEGIINQSQELQKNARDQAFKASKHENRLWNILNRYVNTSISTSTSGTPPTSNGLTLFFAPAGGLPKEIWEPVLARIFSSSAAATISEVWTWDSVQHGDSGLVNAKALTGFFDWSDNSRDIVNFLLHFLPSIPLNETLPLYLTRVTQEETNQRISHGFQNRNVILVGHSFSGACLVLGAYHYPNLSSAMILVDPVLVRPGLTGESGLHIHKWNSRAIQNVLKRQDTWESKEEAYTELASSSIYADWDPEMLRAFVEYGLYETTTITSTGHAKRVVKTKLTPYQEALVNAGGDVPQEAFTCLSDLDERIKLHYIFPGRQGVMEFGPPGAQQERAWMRPKNSSNTRIHGAGHLVPQERVQEFAQDVIEFLERHYSSNKNIRASL